MTKKQAEQREEKEAVWLIAASQTKFRRGNELLELPDGWVFVPKGDAALTRRIKAQTEYWQVLTHYRQKPANAGLCAPSSDVERIRKELVVERETPQYAKRMAQGRQYRAKKEAAYRSDFKQSVLEFLHFHPRWAALADKLAQAVTEHATPVGSGTVARTEMIPIEKRAEAAVIAWMRHQTTNYDKMYIERVAGRRREVRRNLAESSRELISKYRSGADVDVLACPLARALDYRNE